MSTEQTPESGGHMPSGASLGPILSQATPAEIADIFNSSYGQFKERERVLVKKVKERIKQQKQAAKEAARQEAKAKREQEKAMKGRNRAGS